MQIFSHRALSHTEYLGCLSAFWSALGNALGLSENHLVRLAGKRKGAHFGWETELDKARYGALIVLERWKDLNERFAGSLGQTPSRPLAEAAPQRCAAAAQELEALYAGLDGLEDYEEGAVREAIEKLRGIAGMFAEERAAAAGAAEMFAEKESAAGIGLLPVLEPRAEAHKDRPATPAEIFRDFREQFLVELSRR